MIKLKSLFRRGQSSSTSSKHSNSSSSNNATTATNNRNKSQSTTSLNSVAESEKQQQQKQPPPPPHSHSPHLKYKTKFYPNYDPAFERGVDVGDDRSAATTDAAIANSASESRDSEQSSNYASNTLPNKKTTTKKGQKQPKQLPATSTAAKQQHSQQHNQQQSTIATNNAVVAGAAPSSLDSHPTNVMSTTATTAASAAKIGNNNYTDATCSDAYNEDAMYQQLHATKHQQQHQTQHHQQAHAHHHAINSAAAASYIANQQFLDKEQQQQQQLLQMQLLETNNKMQELHAHLDRLSREKLMLETRIEELLPYQSEVSQLHKELFKMQSQHEKSQLEIANLKYENESLRNRLHDVVNSPLSDAEKHQIIQDSQRLQFSSSAPASIAVPSLSITTTSTSTPTATTVGFLGLGPGSAALVNSNTNILLHQSLQESDVVGGAIAATTGTGTSIGTPSCLTPDWDKHSSSSEISVACLQDKIIQMEETHYSTNEELQATLQELADLQSQLSDAQTENERLGEEKDVLFQSLCRQTEKLKECRTQITTLQELLLRDAKQAEIGTAERENKLLDLIKTAQEEREAALLKQEEQNSDLQELRQSLDAANKENARFRERIAMLDSTIDAANAERKQNDLQLQQAKDEISQRSIEINRLTTLLENARSKIEELEQDLARGEKTDLSDLLDAARKEKDSLEERVAEVQDQCSRSQAEVSRLKDQLSAATEECKVAKNNAKCAVSHLEYRLEQLQQEKDKLSADYQQLAESTTELQVQSKCNLEDKTQLQNLLSETQKHLGEVERKLNETEEQLEKELELRKQEAEEWNQFQSDLLMTVRVANDFKTEALTEREQLVIDNKTQKEKIRLLEQQIEKLTQQQLQQNETQQSVLSTVQQEMASRRNKIASSNFNRQDSRLSVKTLIETIENNKQNAKQETENEAQTTGSSASTPDSTPNILPGNGIASDGCNNSSNKIEWTENLHLPVISSGGGSSNGTMIPTAMLQITPTTPTAITSTITTPNTKVPMREQQQQQQQQNHQQQQPQQSTKTVSSLQTFGGLNQTGTPKSGLSGERKDPLNMLAKNGGSKRNALLKWCQNKTVGYRNIDITNFSSSWNDGLAFCAILHSYLPDRIPYDTLTPANKRQNFSLAFAAAESVGITTTLNINDMCQIERPDWMQVMGYVTAIYKHFET